MSAIADEVRHGLDLAWIDTRRAANNALARAWRRWRPPPRLSTAEWARQYRRLSPEASAKPGRYDISLTPVIRYLLDALDDPRVWKVVCKKSAQFGWTDGVINNYIGRRIHLDPCPMIAMFPKAEAAKDYSEEKFRPMVEVTPALAQRVDLSRGRRDGNRALYKKFPGGFLKMVGSNSISSVKSTPAPVIIIEEPDDANTNLKGQGDSIKLLEERTKTYELRKHIYGGTPSIENLSAIDHAYKESDQGKAYVPCHECGQDHVLDWANVSWLEDAPVRHETYGHARPETAVYVCPHCGVTWDDEQKRKNVERFTVKASAPFHGVIGLEVSELYSAFPGSRLEYLVRRYLAAKHAMEQGDDRDMIVFNNSTLGKCYSYSGSTPPAEILRERAEEYPELQVQRGGIVLTIGIDVQHDRFALIVRAWGRGMESWLIYWGEMFGAITDSSDAVWDELERFVFGAFKHQTGADMYAKAVSIDGSDGQTSELVYVWAKRMAKQYRHSTVMVVKGDSERQAGAREIFSIPRAPVEHRTPTKAQRHGLRIYQVGTTKAKDLILGTTESGGRIKLQGAGPGRMHHYKDVRADYFDQVTAELKAPSRRTSGKLVWQKKTGQRNEALDCEVYALHAAYALKLHLWTPERWDQEEGQGVQPDLFVAPPPAAKTAPAAAPQNNPFQRGNPGLGSDGWNLGSGGWKR